jgi:hypothetical protein
MNLAAIRLPSIYAPFDTCSNMSLIHAAEDSSKADINVHIRFIFVSRAISASRALVGLVDASGVTDLDLLDREANLTFQYYRSVALDAGIDFMNHVTFRMPMLSYSIPGYFNELLEDRTSTAMTSYSELRTVMEMTINLVLVFVITILRSKNCVAEGTGEMFNVVFLIKSSDIGSSQCCPTSRTQQVETSKIISFT